MRVTVNERDDVERRHLQLIYKSEVTVLHSLPQSAVRSPQSAVMRSTAQRPLCARELYKGYTVLQAQGQGLRNLLRACSAYQARVTKSKENEFVTEATDESYKIHRNLKDEVISVAVSKKTRWE